MRCPTGGPGAGGPGGGTWSRTWRNTLFTWMMFNQNVDHMGFHMGVQMWILKGNACRIATIPHKTLFDRTISNWAHDGRPSLPLAGRPYELLRGTARCMVGWALCPATNIIGTTLAAHLSRPIETRPTRSTVLSW